jgi:hypothetical protein
MTRIAICISGFLRTWEHTKRSFLEQLVKGVGSSNLEYDLFIHTYKQNLYEFTAGEKDVLLTEQDLLDAFKGFNVKRIVYEDREEVLPCLYKETEKYKHISNYGLAQLESSDGKSKEVPIGVRTYDNLRKVHLCNELRKEYEKHTNTVYDLVVKTRFDIVYFNSFDWDALVEMTRVKPNLVFFGYGATFGYPDDTFCVCTPNVMDRGYASRVLLFDEMFLKPVETLGICAHSTLKYIFDKEGVEISNHKIVNISCFRSKDSFQYGQNYRKRCDIDLLYNAITSKDGLNNDVYMIEGYKAYILMTQELCGIQYISFLMWLKSSGIV